MAALYIYLFLFLQEVLKDTVCCISGNSLVRAESFGIQLLKLIRFGSLTLHSFPSVRCNKFQTVSWWILEHKQ